MATAVPTNGRWGEVQQYWGFTQQQMNQLRERFNEHELGMVHYKKKLYFTESFVVEEVFDAFMQPARSSDSSKRR